MNEYIRHKTTLEEIDVHCSWEVFRRNTQEDVIDRDEAENVIG